MLSLSTLSRSSMGLTRFAVRSMSSVPEITKVGVVGAGLMGHGIMQTAAEKGFEVIAVDSADAAVERGMGMIEGSVKKLASKAVAKGKMSEGDADAHISSVLGRISAGTDRGALADCDIIVEAVIEDMAIKEELYTDLGKIVKPSCVFASNTSSFEIGYMSGPSGRPDKMVGLHFFNPVQLMKLVEVVRTPQTSDESFDIAFRFGQALGKEAVACKDTPGFIVNRLLVPFIGEAIAMLERGDATKEDIDTAMRYGTGHPMGPITLADYTGLDTMLFVLKGWVENYPNDPSFRYPKLLEEMVASGNLGRKTGQGFYKWEGNKVVG